jgi:hypothetical protein
VGVGFIPQSAWVHFEKDDNLVEPIQASRIAHAKLLKIAWGIWNWTLESNKCNQTKEMDAISKYPSIMILKSFMDDMFPYSNFILFYIICIF